MKIFFNPLLTAAIDFSLKPPIGSTAPLNVISPVIPKWQSTGRFDNALTNAVVSVTPADGPSFGTAPSGTWICTSFFSKKPSGILNSV